MRELQIWSQNSNPTTFDPLLKKTVKLTKYRILPVFDSGSAQCWGRLAPDLPIFFLLFGIVLCHRRLSNQIPRKWFLYQLCKCPVSEPSTDLHDGMTVHDGPLSGPGSWGFSGSPILPLLSTPRERRDLCPRQACVK